MAGDKEKLCEYHFDDLPMYNLILAKNSLNMTLSGYVPVKKLN